MLTVQQLLDFEARWPNTARGKKDDAILRELGVNPPRYYQLLHRAARSLEGQEYDAVTAHRIVRMLNPTDRLHSRLHL